MLCFVFALHEKINIGQAFITYTYVHVHVEETFSTLAEQHTAQYILYNYIIIHILNISGMNIHISLCLQ